MGGIVGLFHLNTSPVDEELLQQMITVTQRKARGVIRLENILTRQLEWGIVNTTQLRNPIGNNNPYPMNLVSCALFCDGRVDNREELIAQFAINGKGRVITDVELILAAYRKWGSDCTKHIVGDFAFAIWDKIQQRSILCPRLYWCEAVILRSC